LFGVILCGCSAVYSTDPIGEKACRLSGQDWEGTWINKETFLSVKVTDAGNGMIRAAWIESSDHGDKLESYEVQLRQSGELVFGNVKTDDGSGRALYVWGLVKRDGNELICWKPDVDKFRDLCAKGELPCKEEEGNLTLTTLSPEHVKTINSEKKGVLYQWHDPLVFIRTASGR
jgi:hypothetical protein